MTSSLRPDERARTACAVAALLGLAAIAFASFGLVLVGTQRLMLTAMTTHSPDPGLGTHMAMFDALHGAWLVHMPLWIVLGTLLVATGLTVRRGTIAARWLQVVCVFAAVELCAYVVHLVFGILPVFERAAGLASGAFGTATRILGGAGALFALAFAIPFLLIAQAVSRSGRTDAPASDSPRA